MTTATRPAGLTKETKRTPRMVVKLLDQEGAFTARFATFNVIDRDGDVTLAGVQGSPQGSGSVWRLAWPSASRWAI